MAAMMMHACPKAFEVDARLANRSVQNNPGGCSKIGRWTHDVHSLRHATDLILSGRSAQLYAWLKSPRSGLTPRQAVVFLKDVFVLLARANADDAILAAALKVPVDGLLALVPTYYAACVLLRRRNFEPGFAMLTAFRNRCLDNLAALPTEDTDGFLVLFRHAVLLDDDRYSETAYFRSQVQVNESVLDQLHWARAPEPALDDGRPVLMVACDHRYAGLFFGRFLASVDRLCRGRLVHLHIVDPIDPARPDAGLPTPRHNRLAVSWESSGPFASSAYYASARFVRVGELMRHYQRPIQIFDVDVALRHPPETLDHVMEHADFGCFRTGMLNPCSEFLAEVTAFMPTSAGLELADLLRRLILSKMSIKRELLWLVDQAVLYTAIYRLAEKAGRLRVADFTRKLGVPNDQYIEQCESSAVDKLAMMKTAATARPSHIVSP